jgi:hypothetical protein
MLMTTWAFCLAAGLLSDEGDDHWAGWVWTC